MFTSLDIFRNWYISVKEKFQSLKIVYLKAVRSIIHVVIAH